MAFRLFGNTLLRGNLFQFPIQSFFHVDNNAWTESASSNVQVSRETSLHTKQRRKIHGSENPIRISKKHQMSQIRQRA